MCVRKWTYEKCKEELSKYDNIIDFKNRWIYKVIIKNKWNDLLSDFYKIKPKGYWTYERCKEISSKCNSSSELNKINSTAYKAILENKWIDLIENFNKKITYDYAKSISLKFQFKKDLKNDNPSIYNAIIRNKWYDILEDMEKIKPKDYWSYENCINEIKKYKDLKDFTKDCSGALKAIYKNNWNDILDDIRIIKPNGYWSYEKCKEVTLKYNSIGEFRKENGGAYYTINLNNWNHLFDHMKILPNFYKRLIYVYEFDDNSCYVGLTCDVHRRHKQHMEDLNSSVNKHITKTGLIPNLIFKSDYIDVRESIKLEECILLEYKNNGFNILNKNKTGSIGGIKLYWTKERCIEEVKKYKTHSEFRKGSSGAYNSSYKNGWLYEILEKYIPSYKKRKSPN